MKNLTRRLLIMPILLALMIFSSTLTYAKPSIPAPSSEFYYYDEMGVLSDETKDEILKTNIELQNKIKSQIAVVTVNDLQEYPVEDFALEMFRKWGIGDKDLNNGVLILLGKEPTNDKYNIFIATGYGVEGTLNDGKVGRILDNYFIPIVDRDDLTTFDKALLETFRAVVSQVALEYEVELDGNFEDYADKLSESGGLSFKKSLIIFIIIFVIYYVLSMFFDKDLLSGDSLSDNRSSGSYGSSGSSGGSSGFSGGGGSSGGGGAGRSF